MQGSCPRDHDDRSILRRTIRGVAASTHGFERGFSRVFFVANFMRGGKQAVKVGVRVGLGDYIAAAAAGILIAARMTPYAMAARIPVIREAADRS